MPASGNDGKLVVYNILGTVVKEVAVSTGENEKEIDTESLSTGTYFVQLQSKENTVIGKGTFVKQ